MSESTNKGGRQSAQIGNVGDNQGNVASGSSINQSAATARVIVSVESTDNSPSPSQSTPSNQVAPNLPVSWHDNRRNEARPVITDPTPAEEERFYNLSSLLQVSRYLVLNPEVMLLPISHLFNRAKTDGLENHYQAAIWLTLESGGLICLLLPQH